MKVAINSGAFLKFYNNDMFEAMNAFKAAGFDAMDFSIMTVQGRPEWDETHFEESAKRLREHAEKLELPITQTHSGGDPIRALKISALCGAKQCVIHPRIIQPHLGHEDANFQKNMEFYSQFAETALKVGCKVGVENMFKWEWNHEIIQHSSCSRPEEFLRYMDALEERFPNAFTAVLDVGHLHVVQVDPADCIRKLGKHLSGLHIHDNCGYADHHAIPGVCKNGLNFASMMEALREIDFKGDFTLEVSHPNQAPALMPATLEFLQAVSRYYADLMEVDQV